MSVFATVFVALFVAHQVGDHWVQSDHQACTKGQPGWHGRYQCAMHVGTYTLTAAIVLATTEWALGLGLDGPRVLLGLAISAVTHYVADRRTPLKRLADLIKLGYWDRGGSYQLDQSWHYLWLWVAALVIA